MRKLYAVLLFTLLASSRLFAQTGELQGKVIDAETGKGIGFVPVAIYLNGAQRGANYTDESGNYAIKPIVPGTYTIKTQSLSYNPVEINGVIVSADKITFQDVKMSKTVKEIETIVITAEPPLVEAGVTAQGDTKTRTEIQQLATNRNNPNDIIGTAAGVFQADDGNALNIAGSRSYSQKYYVDGIPMRGTINLPSSAIEQLTLITGGIPARYGDATGGVINITTRGPSREYHGGLELATSEFIDPFGYRLANANFSGPLLTRYRKTDSADARIGFFLTAEYEANRDADPSAYGMWRVKEDVLNDIKANPLQPSDIGIGFVQRSQFVTREDLEQVDVKQNVSDASYRFSSKIDFKLNRYMNLTIGGNADMLRFNGYDYIQQLFAPEHNLFIKDNTYRGFVRFTQRFAAGSDKAGNATVFQNAYYTIQADYSKFYETYEDKLIGDNPFDYGYVGKFKTHRMPLYNYGVDPATGLTAHLLTGYTDTLVTFEPGTVNPELTAYTKAIYELTGSTPVNGVYGLNGATELYSGLGLIQNLGGLRNGDLPGNVYSLWRPTGYPGDELRKLNNTQYRVAFQGSVDLVRPSATSKGDKNRHALEFGFEYEQREDRGWRLFPVGLWGLARQYANSHLVLDAANPIVTYNEGFPGDTISYNLIPGPDQSFFDAQLRAKLGAAPGEWIDVDYLDPDQLSLDMFSPDELFPGGSGGTYVQYWGYDWKGDLQNSNPDFFDFFNSEKEQNGVRFKDRPIGAFRPIYTAAYLQDKFNFRDIIFNIGVRVDRYDANQKVLKDPYSLVPLRTAGEVTELNGLAVTKPENIGDDYYVYVNSLDNPSEIVGYRDGDTWYDASGAQIADPKLIAQNTSTGTIAPYVVAGGDPDVIDPNAFKDYDPQWSIMPRIAFSFPISDQALFFAHYDVLTQRPGLNRSSPYDYEFLRLIAVNARLNNPDLRPEKTIDYQVGFQQALGTRSALTLSLTYKELKNMVQVRKILYAVPIDYTTYGNLDFGTVKSFQASYEMRRTRNVRLELNYTLQFAEGTGSDQTSALNLINSGAPNLRTIVPFNYDQRHTITATVDYRFAGGLDQQGRDLYNGPVIGNTQILKNTGLNTIFRVGSGTPYSRQLSPTPDAQFGVATQSSLRGNINGSRLPYTFKIDMRLDRDFVLTTKKSETSKAVQKSVYLNAYVMVQNLLNTKNVVGVYAYSGSPNDDAYLSSPEGQQNIQNQPSEQSFVDLYNIKVLNPNNFTQPRRIRVGLSLNF